MGLISQGYHCLTTFTAALSGSMLTLSLPKENHPRIPANEETTLDINIYDASKFEQFPGSQQHELYTRAITYRHWVFWQRRFLLLHREACQSNLEANIFKLSEFSSLFDKTKFEHAVERFIFASGYSFASSGLCRLHWRIREYNGTQWIAFENDGRQCSTGHNPFITLIQTFYLTPVSDEHMLMLCFTQIKRREVDGIEAAFDTLRETIMQSSSLELSSDASRQKKEADAANPGQHYSQTLPPYEYDLPAYPDRQSIRKKFGNENDFDTLANISTEDYKKTIDQLEKDAVKDYNEKTKKILQSHLRFKK